MTNLPKSLTRILTLTLLTALLLAAALPASASDLPLAKKGERKLGIASVPQLLVGDEVKTPDDRWEINISYNARGHSITVQLPLDGPMAADFDAKPVWFTLDHNAIPGQGTYATLREIEIAGTCYSGEVIFYSDDTITLAPQFIGNQPVLQDVTPVEAAITPDTLNHAYDDITQYATTHPYYEIIVDDQGNALEIVPTNG